jgi:hypothetical protein
MSDRNAVPGTTTQHLRGDNGAPLETCGRADRNLLRLDLRTSEKQFTASLVGRPPSELLLQKEVNLLVRQAIEAPHFLDNALRVVGEVVRFRLGLLFNTRRRVLMLCIVRGCIHSRVTVQLEESGHLKCSMISGI